MEPLITNRENPAWLCYKKHVELLHFVLQQEVCAETGPAQVEALVDEFYESFSKVPEWQDGAYEKPKMHLFHELSRALTEFGPWRAYWCMPWESFLQVLKHIFEGTNYVNGPLAVCKFWAVRAVMRYRDGKRSAWYTDSVESDEDFTTDRAALAVTSPLVAALLQEPERPYSVRHITSVTREREQILREDWVLVEQDQVRVIARVRDMMECLVETAELGVHNVVRLWCEACVEPNTGEHGELWALPPPLDSAMLVSLEDVHVAVKTRNIHALHDVYT